jgi:hypothetical protein
MCWRHILLSVQQLPGLTSGRRALWTSLCALGAAGLVLLLAAAAAAPADAARKGRADPLVAPARITTARLAKPGARIRIRARRGTRAVAITLRRRGRAHVVARKLRRVRARRHARRVVVRLRVRVAVMRRLRPGVYIIRVRTRRGSRGWSRRAMRQRIRLVAPGRRIAGTGSRPVVPPGQQPPAPTPSPAARPVTVAAAGDISCDSLCPSTLGTAALIRDVIHPAAVLGLGDFQDPDATIDRLNAFYDKSWGAFKAITYAVPGNHDPFPSRTDPDYVDYFNAGGPVQLVPEASYSFDLGAWHIVALNSLCFSGEGCTDRNAWTSWLKRDLAAHPQACTLAFLHHPYWRSPSVTSRTRELRPWIEALYDAGADVLLQAHQHAYERFHPQNPDSERDDARGIVAFTVGTGGDGLIQFTGTHPNSAARSDDVHGVLQLTLHPGSYDFRFHSVGGSYTDAGSGSCH